ncbi:MAG: ASKHA domain-containing protein [Methanomassiliicoccaceae archaeon]|nr:ASKHA domain-containing protein [Methanomassiliicoccaceae archaeon]
MAPRIVRFYPIGKEVVVDGTQKIVDAAKLADIDIKLPCGGKGRCGRCVVYVTETPMDKKSPDPNGMERVLACQKYVTNDIDVFLPLDEDGRIVAGEDRRKAYEGKLLPVVKARGKTQLGLAVDLGTAAIAVSILDLKKGNELYSTVGDNPQSFAGDDLGSRRAYAEKMGDEVLRKAAIDRINDLMYIFVDDPEDIKAAVISGKPFLMESLTEVCSMAEGPFCLGGTELGLSIAKDAPTYAVKDISDEVGGDLIGGIIGSNMDISEMKILLVDLGSTVQLALGNREGVAVCASESGPAIEGGNVTFGMTPSIGAIDSVMFRRKRLNYTVIGGIPPTGICGSGLIDLLAQMFRNGLVDADGKFTKKAKVFQSEKGRAFPLTDKIYVTESDIASVIKAKAAVFAAVRALMEYEGTKPEDVSKIVISGSFGNFINADNAISIGMLPDADREKYDYLGNASMTYAKNVLLSEDVRNRADEVRKRIRVMDTHNEIYETEFRDAYYLPNRKDGIFPPIKKKFFR